MAIGLKSWVMSVNALRLREVEEACSKVTVVISIRYCWGPDRRFEMLLRRLRPEVSSLCVRSTWIPSAEAGAFQLERERIEAKTDHDRRTKAERYLAQDSVITVHASENEVTVKWS